MNDDIRPDESGEDRDDRGTSRPAIATRDVAVTGTYTDISGDPAFVLAAVDHPDAWLAVPPDVAVDTEESR